MRFCHIERSRSFLTSLNMTRNVLDNLLKKEGRRRYVEKK
jgi:hypothetical protein